MDGKYLLDTNIVIDLFNNDKKVIDWILGINEVYIPNVAIGELYYGFLKSTRKKDNLNDLEDLIISSSILDTDINTSKIYGEVKNKLRIKGKPIPDNDIWISAIAIQHSVTLVTRDRHFENVDNISLEVW